MCTAWLVNAHLWPPPPPPPPQLPELDDQLLPWLLLLEDGALTNRTQLVPTVKMLTSKA